MNLFLLQRIDEAITAAQNVLKIDPKSVAAQTVLADSLMEAGRYKEGIENNKLSFKLVGFEEILPAMDRGYANAGYKGACLEAAEALVEISNTKYVMPVYICWGYLYADQKEKALYWLEKMYEVHDPNLPYITTYPSYNRISKEPRFQEIARKINLPCK
jgi:tetratricopeptide (TPR) repeat protein